ncbi:MAG: right-handed parallel beta-helix repeat-containing protein [Phycisphaerales bacterium]|jgi:hypothetical protein
MLNRFYATSHLILMMFIATTCWADLDVQGPYLGQPSPGLETQIFAPGIISTRGNTDGRPVWTPDGLELYYFSSGSGTYTQGKDGFWTEPRPLSIQAGIPPMFMTVGLGFAGPRFSGDGQRAYVTDGHGVWMSERTDTGWSEARNLNIPEHNFELWWFSVTNDGTLYMTMGREATSTYYIYRARPDENGEYPTLENMNNTIGARNSFYNHISLDESILILTQWNVSGGYGDEDLYISFRDEQDNWTHPRNLGPKINTSGTEWSPFLTADGKYLFYNSQRAAYNSPIDMLWIEARAVLPDPNGPFENTNTGQRFGSIQLAIDNTNDGEVIVLQPGIYNENVNLGSKNIKLQSVDPNNPSYIGGTIIQGSPDDPVITLQYNSEACEIAGLTIRAGLSGIAGTSTDVTIRNCRIMDNVNHGLELARRSEPHLLNCLIAGNGQAGIMNLANPGRGSSFSAPLIENCVIVQNGSANIDGGQPIIVDSIVSQ